MTQDTKLLIGVAGCVIVGAAVLALLGGIVADREAASEARTAEVVKPAADPTDTGRTGPRTVSFTRPIEPEPSIEPPVLDLETEVVEVEVPFEIDPEADFVAEGLRQFNAREYDRAAAYFEAEADARPDRAWTHYILALSRWKAGEADAAVVAMQQAADIEPTSVKTFVNLSRIQNDRGDYDAALEAARRALEIDAGAAEAMFLEGRSLRNLGRGEEAVEALRRSVELDPGNGYAQNLLGLTLIELDRETEAVPALEAAVEAEADVAYIRNNLGMAYERCGRRGDAILAYREAVRLGGGRADANLARLDPEGRFEPIPETDPAEQPTVEIVIVEDEKEAVEADPSGL